MPKSSSARCTPSAASLCAASPGLFVGEHRFGRSQIPVDLRLQPVLARAPGATSLGKSACRSCCTDTLSASRGGAMPASRQSASCAQAALEHPGADIDDQAALLGSRYELARLDALPRAGSASAAAPPARRARPSASAYCGW